MSCYSVFEVDQFISLSKTDNWADITNDSITTKKKIMVTVLALLGEAKTTLAITTPRKGLVSDCWLNDTSCVHPKKLHFWYDFLVVAC